MNVSNFYSRDVRKEEKMKGLIKAADGLTAVILTLAAGTMIGAIFLQVFFRFVVQSPLYWTEELSRYSFVYVVFIGSAWAGKKHMHLGVDYFTLKLPDSVMRVLRFILDCLILAFSAVIVAAGVLVVPVNLKQSSPALHIPMGAVYAAIPIGFGLLFVYYLEHLLNDLNTWKQP